MPNQENQSKKYKLEVNKPKKPKKKKNQKNYAMHVSAPHSKEKKSFWYHVKIKKIEKNFIA